MLAKPKQIIVDKEALVGINIGDLSDFARNHLLLCSDTLLYECATASQSKRKNMLDRCDHLLKAGAYYCPCSIGFLQFEGNHCCPYPSFLTDLNATDDIRKACLVDIVLNCPDKIKTIFSSRAEVARNEFLGLCEKIKNMIDIQNSEVGEVIKKLPSETMARLQLLFGQFNKYNLHQVAIDTAPAGWIKDEERFCLSPKWMSWQRIRLIKVMVMNYHYPRQLGGGPGEKRAEHDYQDMEYVLLLSRADGLLTKDNGCLSLAKAAFPDKDVFSSLDEVSEDYICNWI